MSISYQRNSVRGPLATTCPVHTTILWIRGSVAETAWVSRASSVSSRFVVPFCGALPGGTAYVGSVIDTPVTVSYGTVGAPGSGLIACAVSRLPLQPFPGHSASDGVA